MKIELIKYVLDSAKITNFKNGQAGFRDILILILSLFGGIVALGILIWVLHVYPQK